MSDERPQVFTHDGHCVKPDLLDAFIKAWMDDWLENNLEDFLEENWHRFRPTLEKIEDQRRFEFEQECVNEWWTKQYPGIRPAIGVLVQTPLGYVKGEIKTYERVYDIDRAQDIWLRIHTA